MKLKARVAIVTGGARGIGQGIARALAAEGARVAIFDIDGATAQKTAAEIPGARAWGVDVTAKAQVDQAVGEVEKTFGAVHILVNNAGWDRPMPFFETNEEFWNKILAVNLKGPIICTRAVLDSMIKQGGGKIVFIASDAGRVGSTGEAVYSAAEGGLIAFTKTLARELARQRINVDCVSPGPSDTPLFEEEFAKRKPGLAEALRKAIPWGRLGRPEDIARAVVFFASDDAEYITGQTLSVSGGLTMV